ncbi:protein kinase domain-containing protein [Streptomyces sp. NPDC003691]
MSEAEQSRKPQRDGSEERASAAVQNGGGSGARSGADGGTGADRAAAGAGAAGAVATDTAAGGTAAGEPAGAEGGGSAAKTGSRSGADPVIGTQADRRAKEKPSAEESAADSGADSGAEDEANTADATDPADPADTDGGPERAGQTSGQPSAAGSGAVKSSGADGGTGTADESPRRAGADDREKAPGGPAGRGGAADGGRQGGTARSGAAARGSRPGSGSGSGSGSGDSEGRLLAGRYRLGGVLGRGGMGTVWRAEDETLSRTVAVKELRFPNQIDEDEKRRLITRTLREAKAIARIRNTSAVTVYDVVDEDDRPWIVMELVEGKSLAEVIREDGTLTPRRAAEVGLAILDVLRSAHREGILHRDVKPSNVLIADDGRVVLTDFGIALVEGDPSITSTGMLVGAPSYISPERARGQRPGPAADLWSLGGLIYASVEGAPPYDKGSAIATLTAVMTEPLDPPKNAGPLEEVIYGLLAKDPEQRLDDAGARALLVRALSAPDVPAEAPLAPDATRAMTLPTIPPPEPRTPPRPGGDRTGGPGRPVRAAAPAAAASAAHPPRQPAAPLTDVVPRRTLVLLAVGIVLAVLGTVLYLTIGNDGNGDAAKDGGTGGTTTSAGAPTGKDAKETGGGAGQEKTGGTEPDGKTDGKGTAEGATGKDGATPGASAPPAGKDTGKDAALPTGYAVKSDDQFRFTMAMPGNFSRTNIAGTNSGGIYNTARGSFPRVQVDFNGKPGKDAVAAWENAVGPTRSASTNYQHIGIKAVQFNGYRTVADWEFERDHDGKRMRVLNRGFVVDDKRGYSIMVSCPVAEWNATACKTLRETAFATFKPKD